MTRLILLVILGIVAVLYFPESRSAVFETARPVLTPVFRWQTQREMSSIARELQTFERENYGQLPQGRRWPGWLKSRFMLGASTDSWGTDYHLMIERDSFAVVSFGPDGAPRTDDDLREARRLARPDLPRRR